MRTQEKFSLLTFGSILVLIVSTSLVAAQQSSAASSSPTPKKSSDTAVTAGEDAGDFMVTSSVEIGYRGLSVDGDQNKYRSDLNYKAGPRLFDSSFLLKAKDGHDNGLFETFLV